METLIEFFSFQYPNIKYVVFGTILLSISSAVVGCFTFIKKKSLVGDVISHAVLPGICISFMASGSKDPFLLIIGAFISGWLSILVMNAIIQNTKIKEDAATGLSLSVFFGIGILLMTYIQHSGNASQSGLDTFLFGKAAALVGKGFTCIQYHRCDCVGFGISLLQRIQTHQLRSSVCKGYWTSYQALGDDINVHYGPCSCYGYTSSWRSFDGSHANHASSSSTLLDGSFIAHDFASFFIWRVLGHQWCLHFLQRTVHAYRSLDGDDSFHHSIGLFLLCARQGHPCQAMAKVLYQTAVA